MTITELIKNAREALETEPRDYPYLNALVQERSDFAQDDLDLLAERIAANLKTK